MPFTLGCEYKWGLNAISFVRGDEEESERLTKELAELEERADMLSKRPRSQTMSTISFINERNRKQNVERAEEAIMEEIRASGGQKVDDPFTRRSTKPRMIHKPVPANDPLFGATSTSSSAQMPPPESAQGQNSKAPGDPSHPLDLKAPAISGGIKDSAKPGNNNAVPKAKANDLFSAHDFDIKIDLEVPLPCKY